MKTIYISGPITGLPLGNKQAFDAMHARIIAAGHIPVNPHVICANLPAGSSHQEYMRVCIAHLAVTDAIIMLPGWENSRGARAEYMTATWCGVEILEEI
jgi:hypothetical protein